jgi:hypothetical protein
LRTGIALRKAADGKVVAMMRNRSQRIGFRTASFRLDFAMPMSSTTRLLALAVIVLVVLLTIAEFGPAVLSGK